MSWLIKRFYGLKRWKQIVLAYPFLLFFSGVLRNPFFACVVALLYLMGLAGLVLVLDSVKREDRASQFLYGGLGGLLVLVCLIWLEILYVI